MTPFGSGARNPFAILFVADESHIKLTPVDSEGFAFTIGHAFVRIPINLISAFFASPVKFFFGFSFHISFLSVFLSLKEFEIFVQNKNPITGKTSNFFQDADLLHFFDKGVGSSN